MACFGLKLGQDLGNRAAHPYQEFRGVPPPPPGPSSSGIQPHVFDGNPAIDVVIWLDSFSRIANINNWSKKNPLNAFPLYLSGVAHTWFISLTDDINKSDLGQLKAPFHARCASGPQDWLLSQQLSTRKQTKGERIDEYIAATRLCQQLKLSDADRRCAISLKAFYLICKAMLR